MTRRVRLPFDHDYRAGPGRREIGGGSDYLFNGSRELMRSNSRGVLVDYTDKGAPYLGWNAATQLSRPLSGIGCRETEVARSRSGGRRKLRIREPVTTRKMTPRRAFRRVCLPGN